MSTHVMIESRPSDERDDESPPGLEEPSPDCAAGEPPVPTDANTMSLNAELSKSKRTACVICRRRKLRCDGSKPSCTACSRFDHPCTYDEARRKSGPKRGYVKALEERLKHVETLLKTQDQRPSNPSIDDSQGHVDSPDKQDELPAVAPRLASGTGAVTDFSVPFIAPLEIPGGLKMDDWLFSSDAPLFNTPNNLDFGSAVPMDTGQEFSWELIALGLDEPLPPQKMVDELHELYFATIHHAIPIIHKLRYLAAMDLAPGQRPSIALRYAIWTLACSATDEYQNYEDIFYRRSRKYLERDFMNGLGIDVVTVATAQTYSLLSTHEFRNMHFPRAWMSSGAAVRICNMMGFNRLDGPSFEYKQCLMPPQDWTEREERRRTFWAAFCGDRMASTATGWPMSIDELDIRTDLPASNAAFDQSRPEKTYPFSGCASPDGARHLSAYGFVIVTAMLFGRNHNHLHRHDPAADINDLKSPFWTRHRQIDHTLTGTALWLPAHLRLPAGLPDTIVVFANMMIHASIIGLHQAAIMIAKQGPREVIGESKMRCVKAAHEIASIMKTISHVDPAKTHPYVPFCLYVAACACIQYLRLYPDETRTVNTMQFLLSACDALKRRNPLAGSFLAHLDVEIETLLAQNPQLRNRFPRRSADPPTASFQFTSDGFGSTHEPLSPPTNIKHDYCNPFEVPSPVRSWAGFPAPAAAATATASVRATVMPAVPTHPPASDWRPYNLHLSVPDVGADTVVVAAVAASVQCRVDVTLDDGMELSMSDGPVSYGWTPTSSTASVSPAMRGATPPVAAASQPQTPAQVLFPDVRVGGSEPVDPQLPAKTSLPPQSGPAVMATWLGSMTTDEVPMSLDDGEILSLWSEGA